MNLQQKAYEDLRKLNLSVDETLNIYLLGSRFWFPHLITSKSDYDYLIVVKNKDKKGKAKEPIKINTHSNNVDALIISSDVYEQMLSEHHFLTIVTYFIPDSCPNKILEKFRPRFKLDLNKFRKVILEELERDYHIAKKHLTKQAGHSEKAQRIVKYCKLTRDIYESLKNNYKLPLKLTHPTSDNDILNNEPEIIEKHRENTEINQNTGVNLDTIDLIFNEIRISYD